MKKSLLIIIGILFLAGSVYFFLQSQSPCERCVSDLTTADMGGVKLFLEVADTSSTRQQGLSGRDLLGDDSGMLFVFDTSAKHGIWMKDMNFPLDILWLDEEKRVIWIEENVSPDTFPEIFSPPGPAQYVLELNAGTAEESGVQIGDIVNFQT